MHVSQVLADLLDEHDALEAAVRDLSDDQFEQPTPSPGWTVADQLGHLTYFDKMAAVAVQDPEGFRVLAARLLESLTPANTMDELTLSAYRAMNTFDLVATWRTERRALAAASAHLDDAARVPWYGPSMGAKSFLTARLMETWAHGQDILDAIGQTRDATDRLSHIARLGFNTRSWSYINRGMDAPDTPIQVALAAPSGAEWIYGPADAQDLVVGTAEDFCLVVTQRRHIDATGLAIVGDSAREWMEIAQAFAGQATRLER